VSGLLPMWVAAPMAMLALVVVAAHLITLRTAAMPESRRRIRIANGWLMLVTIPVLAIAFGYASPASKRVFALAWAVATALVCMVLVLAFVDIANNLRLARRDRRRLRRELHGSLARSIRTRGRRTDDA